MMILLSLLIATLMGIINLTMMKKENLQENKSSSFECGFDPKTSARLPFSMHFFMVAMIFLIFDVEIAIMLPLPTNMMETKNEEWLMVNLMFMVILIVGTVHEWKEGSLKWTT